ncbi:MAG: PTS sugar transporter subunit IIA [Paracoccaceae bacterium]
MDLSTILSPTAVRVASAVSSKKRLFIELGEIATGSLDLSLDTTVEALLERENLGPTGVGNGVALPHARLADINQVSGAFLRLEKPLDFNSADRQPVDLVFALFAPKNAGVEHLKALALVSRTMRDGSICAKLRANSDPATLHAILTETLESRAA